MSSGLRAILARLAAVALLVVGLTGCGGPTGVVRVGATAITKATLGHWISVLATEHLVPDPPSYRACITHQEALAPQSVKAELKEECARQYREVQKRALVFLISSRWLLGEAEAEGLHIGGREVAQRLQGGAQPATLPEQGVSAADTRFAVEAELAGVKIRQRLTGDEPKITQAQIAAYYQRHISRYEHPEQRAVDIAEHIPTAAQATRTRREVLAGKTNMASVSLHEIVHERHPVEAVPGKQALARAIFAARPHVLTGLLLFDREYAFLEVTHVTPASVQPLAKVQSAIRSQLAGEQQKRTLAWFIAGWRRRWTAKTDCSAGYVVQRCRQYKGPQTPEGSLAGPELG